MLVAITRPTDFHAALTVSGRWATSILSDAGADLARRFSDDTRDPMTEFDGLPFIRNDATQHVPFAESAAHLDCTVHTAHDFGGHTPFAGPVTGVAERRMTTGYVRPFTVGSTVTRHTGLEHNIYLLSTRIDDVPW